MALPTATIRTQVPVPLRFADGYATAARVFSFDGLADGQEHIAFGLGDRAVAPPSGGPPPVPLVWPHSECLTGDVFGSRRCDCGVRLREAVERIADSGGFLLYLRQEDLALGHDEDERHYLVAAQMLHALRASRIALLGTNPDEARQLRRFGVAVTARVPQTLDVRLSVPATSRTR